VFQRELSKPRRVFPPLLLLRLGLPPQGGGIDRADVVEDLVVGRRLLKGQRRAVGDGGKVELLGIERQFAGGRRGLPGGGRGLTGRGDIVRRRGRQRQRRGKDDKNRSYGVQHFQSSAV